MAQAPIITTSNAGSVAVTPHITVVVDGGITVADADSSALASAAVSITGGFQSGEDTLGFSAIPAVMGNITVASNANGTLTLGKR